MASEPLTRIEALTAAEALVERLVENLPGPVLAQASEPRRDDRRHPMGGPPPQQQPKNPDHLGNRVSQILRVADFLMKESSE